MIKTLRKQGIEENFLSLMINIYKKPTANAILSGERMNALPAKLEVRQRCPLSSLDVQHNTRSASQCSKASKGNVRHVDEKGKNEFVPS